MYLTEGSEMKWKNRAKVPKSTLQYRESAQSKIELGSSKPDKPIEQTTIVSLQFRFCAARYGKQ